MRANKKVSAVFCSVIALVFALTIGPGAWADTIASHAGCDPVAATAAMTVPAEYMRPDMMAVGDSLYNGVESMSLSADKVRFSVPAQVFGGMASTWKGFRAPDYGKPIITDLDSALRSVVTILRFQKDIKTSIASYADPANPYRSKALFFDNVAVAQADSAQLVCDDAGVADTWIASTWKADKGTIPFDPSTHMPVDAEQWFYDINSRFLLNPSADPTHNHLSQLAQVLARKPKVLLMNIGSNDGLWLTTFYGLSPEQCYDPNANYNVVTCAPGLPSANRDLDDLIANMKIIAQDLATLPDTVVYVNLLGVPRAVANLNPVPKSGRLDGDPRYYAKYQTYFNFASLRTVDGTIVRSMDARVSEVNDEIRTEMCSILGPQHVVFVDLYSLLAKYDAKNAGPNAGNTIPIQVDTANGMRDVALDNRVVQFDPRMVAITNEKFGVKAGGLFSMDNMHPTALGYALIANRVLSALRHGPAPVGATSCYVQSTDDNIVDYQQVFDRLYGNTLTDPLQVMTALSVGGFGGDVMKLVRRHIGTTMKPQFKHKAVH